MRTPRHRPRPSPPGGGEKREDADDGGTRRAPQLRRSAGRARRASRVAADTRRNPTPSHRPAFARGRRGRPAGSGRSGRDGGRVACAPGLSPRRAACPAAPSASDSARLTPAGAAPRPHPGSGGGEGRAAGRLLPQPRRAPSPASPPSPTDPALRANPCPEVTDLTCRLPLPTLF